MVVVALAFVLACSCFVLKLSSAHISGGCVQKRDLSPHQHSFHCLTSKKSKKKCTYRASNVIVLSVSWSYFSKDLHNCHNPSIMEK